MAGELAILSTNGVRKFHAVAAGSKPDTVNLFTYSRPLCGLRGRDSTGFSTSRLQRPKYDDITDEFLTFETASTDQRYSATHTVCDGCSRVVAKLNAGQTYAEATRVRAPQINAKVRAAIDASQSTEIVLTVVKDITQIDNLTERSVRQVIATVDSAPYREKSVYSLDYREEVTYPTIARQVRVTLERTPNGDPKTEVVSATAVLDFFHPKTLLPTTGKKLQRRDYVDESPEIDALRKLLGV